MRRMFSMQMLLYLIETPQDVSRMHMQRAYHDS